VPRESGALKGNGMKIVSVAVWGIVAWVVAWAMLLLFVASMAGCGGGGEALNSADGGAPNAITQPVTCGEGCQK
jgi:hypothetical protein